MAVEIATAVATKRNKFSKNKGKSGENMDNEKVDGYYIPQDPMDLLQCDSCQ